MLYHLFKFGALLALKIYCKKTVVNFDNMTSFTSPKIIASNHPNSFFDAIVIAVQYPKPVYFLARGDAFKKPLVAKFLNALHLIPIYRLSEGKSNLRKNEETFKRCLELLHQNQTILIFSEGLCVNEWKLRPLKKGTARLVLMAIKDGITNLKIQPTNVNYSSFNSNPKEIILNFNQEFEPKFNSNSIENDFYKNFNTTLEKGILENMIVQENEVKKPSTSNSVPFKKIVLFIPAVIGYILNFGIYSFFKNIAHKKTKNTVFYDSVLFGLLLICYPILVTIVSIIVGLLFGYTIALATFVLFPLSAWMYKECKV
jgi:1-acyl-sn-glycerol-3-phosphate acyltransferase